MDIKGRWREQFLAWLLLEQRGHLERLLEVAEIITGESTLKVDAPDWCVS